MRLFTAIDLPEQTRDQITNLIDNLKPTAKLNWSPSENLHITTKFIGNCPEDQLPQLIQALDSMPTPAPFEIGLYGLGWFRNSRQPHSFWGGIHAPAALAELATATSLALEPLGIKPELRPFSPHLTLARIKIPGIELRHLRAAIAQLPSMEFGHFTATGFHLYLSELSPNGSRYTKLREFPFAL